MTFASSEPAGFVPQLPPPPPPEVIDWSTTGAEDRLNGLVDELRGRLHVLAKNINVMLTSARGSGQTSPLEPLVDSLNRQAVELNLMHQLVERLLDFKQHPDPTSCARDVVDLRELVMEILRYDGECLRAARCSCSLTAPLAVLGLWDSLQLRVAIRSMIGHATKLGPGRPVDVSIGIDRLRARAYVKVTDSGSGMAREDCARLFERPEEANGAAHGAGPGLWLVRSIARAHGGDVDILSAPGHGTRLTLSLPYDGGLSPPSAAK